MKNQCELLSNNQIIAKLYVFFIDFNNLFQKGFKGFLNSEPSYIQPWMEGYLQAHKAQNEPLTLESIANIHDIAISHLTENGRGQGFTQAGNRFGLVAMKTIDPQKKQTKGNSHYNTTAEGLNDLMDYWKNHQKYPTHRVIIQGPYGKEYLLPKKDNEGGTQIIYRRFFESNISTPVDILYDEKKHSIEIINKLENSDYTFQIGSEPNFLEEQSTSETINFTQAIQENVKIAILSYGESIAKAKTLKQKINAIVQLCQTIEQNHPWKDGNARTSYILLNTLLCINKMPFTILSNANQLDCCSKEQLTDDVLRGMEHFLKLFGGKLDGYPLKKEEEWMYQNKIKIIPLKQIPLKEHVDIELLNDFLHVLEQNMKAIDPLYFIEKEFYHLVDRLFIDEKLNPETVNSFHALYEAGDTNTLFVRAAVVPESIELLQLLFKEKELLNINPFSINISNKNALDISKENHNQPAIDFLQPIYAEQENAPSPSKIAYTFFGKAEDPTENTENQLSFLAKMT